jgi:hypothetical protein
MKTGFLSLVFLLSLTAAAQHNDAVYLRWKLAPGETLVYKTTMAEQETKSVAAVPAVKDSAGSPGGLLQQLLKNHPAAAQNNGYLSYLRPQAGGGVAIEITMRPIPDVAEAKKENTTRPGLPQASSLKPATVLRGAINSEGGIKTFYLKTEQKNMLALLFQLPSSAVKAGISWQLELNLVSVDQSFMCDSSYRRNIVKCTNIASDTGDTIVTMDYDIEEFVSGEMSPLNMTGQKTVLEITYRGSAEFSVTRGRWLSYEGIMNIVTGGFMASNTSKRIALAQ